MIVYVLALEKNKIYVGKTHKTIEERFEEHKQGSAEWTAKYGPIGVIEIVENADDWDELKYTLKYMSIKGIRNVRGSCFCQLNMSEKDIEIIEKLTKIDQCYACGKNDHLIRNCVTCYKCGRRGHSLNDCYATSDVDGGEISRCTRCGRKNHWLIACDQAYAIDGKKLEKNLQLKLKDAFISLIESAK